MKPGTGVSSYKAHTVSCGVAAKPCLLVAKQRGALTSVESQGRKLAPRDGSDTSFIRGRVMLGCGQHFQQCPYVPMNHVLKHPLMLAAGVTQGQSLLLRSNVARSSGLFEVLI